MKKKLLASAVASALVVGVGADAADVKVSGQVSRAIVVAEDNTLNDTGGQPQFVDNDMSGSRFRIKASHDIGSGIQAGIRLEMQVQSNKVGKTNGSQYTDVTNGNLGDNETSSANVTVNNVGTTITNSDTISNSEDNIDLRYQDLYFSGGFGKVSLGKGDGAGNGSTEVDLSGTAIISGSNITDLYGNFYIGDGLDADGDLEEDSATISSVYNIVDANSRVNRVRYDSPSFSGFGFAVSYGQQEALEGGVKYAGDTSGIKYEVKAYLSSLGESAKDLDDGNTKMGFSGSVVLPSGFNVTATASQAEADIPTNGTGEDRKNAWVKLGYKIDKHAFAIDYGQTEDTKRANSNGTTADGDKTTVETTGVSYVFAPAKGVEVFAGLREFAVDERASTIGTQIDDPTFVTIGSRVKF